MLPDRASFAVCRRVLRGDLVTLVLLDGPLVHLGASARLSRVP
jgi:hypothetical protein